MEKKRENLKNLMNNRDFKELFLDYYLKDDIVDLVLNNDLDNNKTIDELKAKQSFVNFLNKIID